LSEIKKLLKHSSHYFTGHVVAMAAGFISFPFLTRIFSVSEYGVLGLITTTFFIATAISKFGFPNSIVQFYAKFKASNKIDVFSSSIFISSLIISSIVTLIFLFGAHFFKKFLLGGHDISILYLVGALILITCTSDIVGSFFRAEQRTKLFNFIGVIRRYGSVFLGIFFTIYFIKGLNGFFFGQAISGAIILFLLLKLFYKKIKIEIKYFSLDLSMESLRFGFPLMLAEFGHLSLNYIDRYLIQLQLGLVPVGIYTAGYNLSTYVTDIIMYPIAYAVTPLYVEILVKKGEKETKEFLSKALRYFLLVMIPLSLGFISLSKNLIVMLATSKYLESNIIIPYAVIGQSVYTCSLILNNGLFIKKKTYIVRNIMLIACLIKVGFNLLLLPFYGILGAGFATLVTYIIYTVMVTYYSFKEFSFQIDYKHILIYIGSGLVMFLAVRNIQLGTGLADMISKCGIGILVYSAFILLLDKEIRNRFVDLLKNFRKTVF